MKIAMITIHRLCNFGSAFQAMALNRFLRQQGHDCKVIDYHPSYFSRGSLKSRLGRLINWRSARRRKDKYDRFVQRYMSLTAASYRSLHKLKQERWDFDLWIAGGDQLWNEFYPCGQDDAYKLSFVEGEKIAYGTSLGKAKFTPRGLEHLVQEVQGYRAIGIRESSGAGLLQQAGLLQVRQVMDPVFLLKREEYRSLTGAPPLEEPYLFVYLVQSSPLLDKTIDFLAQALHVKVALYAGFVPKCRCDYFLKDLGPEENLSYLYHASFVLSASFHACAFASYLHKNFAVLLPGEDTNARIVDFLGMLDLTEKMVRSPSDLTGRLLEPPDWEKVDREIERRTADSKAFLLAQLHQPSE